MSLGSGGRANPRPVKHYLAGADVIFGIGVSFALTAFGVPMPKNKTIIHATLDPMDLNKDVPAQHGLIGDAKLTLDALNTAMASFDHALPRRGRRTNENSGPTGRWMSSGCPNLPTTKRPLILTE